MLYPQWRAGGRSNPSGNQMRQTVFAVQNLHSLHCASCICGLKRVYTAIDWATIDIVTIFVTTFRIRPTRMQPFSSIGQARKKAYMPACMQTFTRSVSAPGCARCQLCPARGAQAVGAATTRGAAIQGALSLPYSSGLSNKGRSGHNVIWPPCSEVWKLPSRPKGWPDEKRLGAHSG